MQFFDSNYKGKKGHNGFAMRIKLVQRKNRPSAKRSEMEKWEGLTVFQSNGTVKVGPEDGLCLEVLFESRHFCGLRVVRRTWDKDG